jgi:CubicO group peptidase (beta-lactamase class C family)
MASLADGLDRVAREHEFWGVARVDRGGVTEVAAAFGLADRAHAISPTVHTRYAMASGSKAMTALAVMTLVVEGALDITTPARHVLAGDLPLVGDDVTIEHLLAHRSGIGDYLDEDQDLPLDAYLMPVGVQHLATSESFVPILDGFPPKFPPGTAFSYCNGGYVVLAIIAERVAGIPFHELVEQRVCRPAGMASSGFLRSDELPGDAAIGYVDVEGTRRTNVFHLPVRGSGDGGMYTTLQDMAAFWTALSSGTIVPAGVVEEMLHPRSTDTGSPLHYGLGFWRHPTSDVVLLEGCDAGVSFRSVHDPARDLTHTVMSNTTDGAWPISRILADELGTNWR